MFVLLDIVDPFGLESIPMIDSLGLLAAAVLLVGAAVGLRALLARFEKPKDGKFGR